MRCHSTSFGRGIKKRVLMIRDNTDGSHIFVHSVIANKAGESCFENKNLPYDQTLGPLRQSRAIAANEINFNWWPKDFNGNTESTKIPRIILMMEGFSNFTVSTGLEMLRVLGFNLNGETINSAHLDSNRLVYLNIETNGSGLIGLQNVIISGENGYDIPVNINPILISIP